MRTIVLLFFSNVFMTFAWYGHFKYGHAWPLWKAILVSWLIALDAASVVARHAIMHNQISWIRR